MHQTGIRTVSVHHRRRTPRIRAFPSVERIGGRQQHPHPAVLLHPAGLGTGLAAEAPEEVGTHRTADRAAGILGQHQAVHRLRRVRPGGGEEDRRTERDRARIDGDAALGGQRHAERTDRAVVAGRHLAEEDVARVAVEQFVEPRRIGPGPGLDALHRGLLELEVAAIDKNAPDRAVGMAVLVGVIDPQHAAVGQADAPGPLDLQEEELDRVVHPGQRLRRQTALLGEDFAARPVGHDLVALDPAAHALALEFGKEVAELDGQQVVGHPVHREGVAPVGLAAAVEQRLVVAGDHAVDGGGIGGRHRVGAQIGLEELADGGIGLAVDLLGLGADGTPGLATGAAAQAAAALAEGRPGSRVGIVAPARKIAPGNRREYTRKSRRLRLVGRLFRRRASRAGGAGRTTGGFLRGRRQRAGEVGAASKEERGGEEDGLAF